MHGRRYLLDIRMLKESADVFLWERVTGCLDSGRLEKLERIKVVSGRAACAGAGLLLQWAYRAFDLHESWSQSADFAGVEEVFIDDILKNISVPHEFELCFGEHGKPYLMGGEFFYNISHSGDYVFCAVSDREIGADIQKIQTKDAERVIKRFFSGGEYFAYASMEDEHGRADFFAALWARKEALGKLLGDGIGKCIKIPLIDLESGEASGYIWEEYDSIPGYKIVCCTKKQIL